METKTSKFTIVGTGPRDWNSDNDHLIVEQIMRIKDKYNLNIEDMAVVSGGARGYDAALVEVAKGLNISVGIMFPNKTYPKYYWGGGDGNPADAEGFKKMCEGSIILEPASQYVFVYTQNGSRRHSNFIRNEKMIDEFADIVLVGAMNFSDAVKNDGGTASAVRYARQQDVETWFLQGEPSEPTNAESDSAFDPWAI